MTSNRLVVAASIVLTLYIYGGTIIDAVLPDHDDGMSRAQMVQILQREGLLAPTPVIEPERRLRLMLED